MEKKKFFAAAIALLIFWLLNISLFRQNLGSSIRLFNDDYDRSDYALRGDWYLHGQVPYRDTLSEYPQIPTYFFAVPYLFFPQQADQEVNYWFYSSIFSLMMLGFLLAAIILLYSLLPEHKDRAFFLLLPAGLYFTYNRFDIIPGFLVLLSLFFLCRKKTILAGIVLGAATLTKWYPVLLLPIFLSYVHQTQRRIDWKMLVAFGTSCLVIILPTFVAGGFKALLQPYLFHSARGLEYLSLPALTSHFFRFVFNIHIPPSFLIYSFLVLSILPAVLTLFVRMVSFEKAVHWSIVVICGFMLFSRIYSPQWLLWLLPLMILGSRTRLDIALIVLYGVLTYVAFPLTFDFSGAKNWLPEIVGMAYYSVLSLIFLVFYSRSNARPIHKPA